MMQQVNMMNRVARASAAGLMGLALVVMWMLVPVARAEAGQTAGEKIERHGKDGVKVSGTVFVGDRNAFRKAATIDESAVFDQIPAYRRIKKEKVKPETALYHFLLRRANKVFKAALRQAAGSGGFDLVVQTGGIVVRKETLPDITQQVIQAIKP